MFDKREKARRLILESKPILLIGFPMCTAFSTWQRLKNARSGDTAATRRAYGQACQHIKGVACRYREQIDGRCYFLREHPLHASSWALPCMQDLEKSPGVTTMPAGQRQCCATVPRGPDVGRPVRKPIGFI